MTNSTPSSQYPTVSSDHGLWESSTPPRKAVAKGLDRTSSLVNTTLGPFEVHGVIGSGAMSVVLSGTHIEQRVPVAIKAITDESSSDPRFRKHLRDEVQAVATLNHPGIVVVFDYGETDRATERLTDGEVAPGTPYFVMERTRKGTLKDVVGQLRWRQAKSILLTILDAAAHAHANGVVHRDIKPANVLLAKWGGRIIPKLADFGIAYGMEGGSSLSTSVGTPRYMAPEQIRQPWRKHGPWSDLYALGCVAYEMLSGEKLFDANTRAGVYRQHFRTDHPPLEPVVSVPRGLQDWLDKMLARVPGDRFQTAADAALELDQLGKVPEETPPNPVEYDFTRLTPVLDPLLSEDERDSTDDTTPPARRHKLPERWPQPTIQPRSIRIVGAGQGLYGLRSIPLVGRNQELDRMWRAFRKIDESGDDRILVLRGTQGCGKSRLVEWFTQRLEEFGAATILRATHSPGGGPADGLSGMLARHFRTLGANDSEAKKLIHDAMGEAANNSPYELGTMMQVVRPSMDGDMLSTGVQIASPSQRYAVIRRYFDHLAEERPVVVFCDDVQWGSDTLDFARFLRRVRSEDHGPVMMVLVATDEALAESPDEREILADLTDQEGVDEFHIDRLESVHHERLVEELLMLEGDLARDVVRRTSGNPLLAVELIGDWVQRGVLEVGERGFVLRDGVEPKVPDHLHEVWVQRIEDLLTDYSEDAQKAIELAAALGQDVQADEWRAVCDLAGVYLDDSLAAELAERRFARRSDNGWSFAHAILHESIERLARDAGRWIHHRRNCANLMEILYDISKPRVAERLGRYAMSAHEFDRALEPLLRSARGRRRRGEYRAAQQLLSDYIDCLEQMGVAEDDRRWGDVWVIRSRTYLNDDEPKEAKRWARKALDASKEHDWDDVYPQAMGWLALAKQWLGEKDASNFLHRASSLLKSATTERRMRGVFGSVAHGLTSLREFEKAERLLDLDYEEAQKHEDERAVANNQYLRCRVAFFQQEFDDALEHAENALSLFQAVGHLAGAATCQEYMAEIHRLNGDTERAENIYRSCIKLQEAIGFRKAIAQTNLATILLKRGRAAEAEKLFVMAADAFEASGRQAFRAVALAGLLACASSQGWWGTIDEHLEPIRSFVIRTDEAERDLAELLEFAGDHLTDGEQYGDAYEAYELALEQWQRLGKDERGEEVLRKLSRWI